MFPLVNGLPSTPSLRHSCSWFEGFRGTIPLSDSLVSCMVSVRPWPSSPGPDGQHEGLLCGRCCQALLPIFFSPVFSGYCLTSCRATLRLPLARSSPLTHAFIPIRIQKQINTG